MLPTLLEQLASDTLRVSLPALMPEVVLCATIVAMLVAKVLPFTRRLDAVWLATAGLVAAAGLLIREGVGGLGAIERTELFTGMLVHDGLGVFSRGLLVVCGLLVVPLMKITGLAQRDEGQDVFTLVLGALLGMCLMTRANHLMMVFLSVEMASVPSYVLVGIVKGRRRSGEAALKYSIYGAAAAGVMLYGISLLVGVLGTAHLPTIGERLAMVVGGGAAEDTGATMTVLALGAALTLVGMAFKVSAAPFHFWTPDVFAGAPAEVGGFLSTASKTAALVLTIRLLAATAPHDATLAGEPTADRATQVATVATSSVEPGGGVAPVRAFLAYSIAGAALLTCTLGNLAAFGQPNAKRLFAYSTIAHAGYLLMPIAAATLLAGNDPNAADAAIASLLFYTTGYVFLNLTAFATIALVRNARGTELVAEYAGLARSAPFAAVAITLAAFGLLGLPPLVGFFAKLGVLKALAETSHTLATVLLVAVVLNTAASVFYYLRLVKLACVDPPTSSAEAPALGSGARVWLVITATPIVLLGLFPEPLARLANEATRGLFGPHAL